MADMLKSSNFNLKICPEKLRLNGPHLFVQHVLIFGQLNLYLTSYHSVSPMLIGTMLYLAVGQIQNAWRLYFSKLPTINNIKWELHLRWLLVWDYHDSFKFLLDKTPTDIKIDWSSMALAAKTSADKLLILDRMLKN